MSCKLADDVCYHCGLMVPLDKHYSLEINGETHQFCCPGCKAVTQLICSSGMESYYQYRTSPGQFPDFEGDHLADDLLAELKLYNDDLLQQDFINRLADDSCEVILSIEGITCAACVWLLDKQMSNIPGVTHVKVNLTTHRALIRWQADKVILSDILQAIYVLGYKAYPFAPDKEEQYQHQEGQIALRRLALAGIGMMQVMMFTVPLYVGELSGIAEQHKLLFRWSGLLLTTPVVLYSARPFFMAAWRDMRARFLTMDIPVSLAIGGAYLASVWSTLTGGPEVYFDAVCMFTFFLLTGRFLEMRVRHRASNSGNRLARLLPDSAILLIDGEQQVVATKFLNVGDYVLVKTGATIPADGIVIEGSSGVNESALTGESQSVRKQITDRVIGGTINLERPLTVELTSVGKDTRISTIVRLLERAKQEKPGITRLANHIAGYFVFAVLVVAAVVGLYWSFVLPAHAFWITLSVLVVTCPCALSLATPAALTAATGSLSQRGILLTRSHVLESLPKVTHIIFDKTGTLTEGRLGVEEVRLIGDATKEQAIMLASALEAYSEHPIAHVFLNLAKKLPKTTQAVVAEVSNNSIDIKQGKGIEGIVNGCRTRIGTAEYVSELLRDNIQQPEDKGQWILLGNEQAFICWFRLSDTLRPDAKECMHALKKMGVVIELLSGDPSTAAIELGKQLGISHVITGASPEDKLSYIKKRQAEGARVVMVGDGVNDGPVLACANVSIAVGCASDLARANADVLLPAGHLNDIPLLLQKARKTQRIIKQNLGWALIYNLLALPLAAAGWILPYMAAIGMSASSLVVVANALRLNRKD